MNSPAPKEILLIATRSPWSNSSAAAGTDLLMTAAVFDQPTRVIFCGDGVWQLLGNQDGNELKIKTLSRIFPAFELYDIRHVHVAESAMRERGLSCAELVVETSMLDDEAIRELIAHSKAVFVF